MTELQKYEEVNACETFAEFRSVIERIGPVQGSHKEYSVARMIEIVNLAQQVPEIDYQNFYMPADRMDGSRNDGKYGFSFFNKMTRTYGLRSKLIYLKLYRSLE